MNITILGNSKLKWTGKGKFNSNDRYIYYCGPESLRRNGVSLIVNKRVQNAVLGCNLKNRMISVRFQGKPFNRKSMSQPLMMKKLNLTGSLKTYKTFWNQHTHQKRHLFHRRGLECKSQEIPDVTNKFSLEIPNEAVQRLTEFCQENVLVIANTFRQ